MLFGDYPKGGMYGWLLANCIPLEGVVGARGMTFPRATRLSGATCIGRYQQWVAVFDPFCSHLE
jgi:hypothetical protein